MVVPSGSEPEPESEPAPEPRGPWGALAGAPHGPEGGYSPGWASSMSCPSTPGPPTVRAVATGG